MNINGLVFGKHFSIVCASGDVHKSRVTEYRINSPIAGQPEITISGVPHVFAKGDYVMSICNGDHIQKVNIPVFMASAYQPIMKMQVPNEA